MDYCLFHCNPLYVAVSTGEDAAMPEALYRRVWADGPQPHHRVAVGHPKTEFRVMVTGRVKFRKRG